MIFLLAYVAIRVVIPVPLFAQQVSDKDLVIQETTGTSVKDTTFIQGNRWALFVGIANYPSSDGFEIQQLKAPVKDVNALAALLKDPERGGFSSEQVFTLTDEAATRRNILITFNDIAKRAKPEDMVIFYFSGHGYRPVGGQTTYLIPFDLDLRDLDTTCINFDDLARKIREMEASKVVIILDACHAGGVKPTGARAVANTGIVQRYLEAFETSEGRALLLSSDESEVSWEDKENGVFTRFLLSGLKGEADKNEDGIVTFTEVALYVEDTVPKFTRENFPRIQRPTRRYEFGQVRGDIPLALNRNKHAEFYQQHRQLLDKRTGTILRAGPSGLGQTLKEFSLQVVQSAYNKTLSKEQLTEQESLLLPELDALQAGKLTVADYIVRARAIYNLGSGIPLTQLRISVTPVDAIIKLTAADTPNRVISPSSPHVYQITQGRYKLSAQRAGYATHSQELVLDSESESVMVTLERLMGTLQLNVTPTDATVTITPLNVAAPDAEISVPKDLRVQPGTGKKLPIGTYRVTAEKEGYEAATKEPIEIMMNAPTKVTLTLNFEPVKIRQKDGMRMRLIPAGEFSMGDHHDVGYDSEKPVHTVYLDAYYVDETEVTNEQYCAFLNEYGKNEDASGHELLDLEPSNIEKVGNTYKPESGYDKHPVVNVSWYGAAAYAQWVGAKLPTEAQWEKAARGGLVGKKYPCGDDITHDDENYSGTGGKDRWDKTSPVSSFAANGYGLYDMAGNVWEWCTDEYDSNYYSKSPKNNPKGPDVVITFTNNDFAYVNTSSYPIFRGGSWLSAPVSLRCANRCYDVPSTSSYLLGFRCGMSRSD